MAVLVLLINEEGPTVMGSVCHGHTDAVPAQRLSSGWDDDARAVLVELFVRIARTYFETGSIILT